MQAVSEETCPVTLPQLPAGHADVQPMALLLAPCTEPKRPAGQAVHADEEVCPELAEKRPAAQASMLLLLLQKLPARQGESLVEPAGQ